MNSYIVGALLFLSFVWRLQAVKLPQNACPRYFTYRQATEDQFYGEITLPGNATKNDEVNVRFTLDGPISLTFPFALDESPDANRKPRVRYRVNFPERMQVLPKLTRIAVNGQEICTASGCECTSIDYNHEHGRLNYKIDQFNPVPLTSAKAKRKLLKCGRGVSGLVPLVKGGEALQPGQFPWLAAIYKKDPISIEYKCGGSLISARTVLTAAHCFRLTNITTKDILVFLGRYNLLSFSDKDYVSRDVQKLIIHQDFSTNLVPDADLALLQLQSPVVFSRYIFPICLLSETDDPRGLVKKGLVAGWGGDEDRKVSPLPKIVEANIVSQETCLRQLEGNKGVTSNRTICAGDRNGKGPCMGDSGGGLMVYYKGRWLLRGIVSIGSGHQGKCNLYQYVVYTDLTKHISWLRHNLLD